MSCVQCACVEHSVLRQLFFGVKTCQNHVILSLAGIHSVLVALLSEKADVQYVADRISPDRIVAEIQGLGFGAELISESELYEEGQLNLSVRTPLFFFLPFSLSPSLPPSLPLSLPLPPPSTHFPLPLSLSQITGMTCSSCVHLIERTLTQTPGIERAVVTLATGRGNINFDPSVIGPRDIIKIVEV